MLLTLAARQPFFYPAVISSHGWPQLAPFEWQEGVEKLGYVMELSNGRVVRLEFTPAEGGLHVSAADSLNPAEQEETQNAARWMFALDLNLEPFYVIARQEPKLAHAAAGAYGRVLRSATLFEDVVKTILTTNTQWGGTKRMARGLVEAFGAVHPADPSRRAFPTAARLADLDEAALTDGVRLGYRAPYVLELARRVTRGELNLEVLKQSDLPTAELRKVLLGIKGIGGYAAAHVLLILGRYETLPIDSWGYKLVSREFYGGEPVTLAQIEAVFERFGDYRALAYWFWKWG
jgi:3-methyladenine DNA glycosylase/8-oxoguanine DNA glycosylase